MMRRKGGGRRTDVARFPCVEKSASASAVSEITAPRVRSSRRDDRARTVSFLRFVPDTEPLEPLEFPW